MVAMRSQGNGLGQEKRKNKHKWKEKKISTAPTVSDVIAVAKDSLWKAWGKWQYSMFFSLLMLFQAANKNTKKKKKKKKNSSDWSEKTVKCQVVIKQKTCFLLKRYQQKEKPNLSASEWKSLNPSCAVLYTSKSPRSLRGLHFPLWFKSIAADTSCRWLK